MVKTRKDLTGMVFGRLTVIGQTEDYELPSGKREARWLCQCSCGSSPRKILQHSLLRGRSMSCGCSVVEIMTKHGKYKTREYTSWRSMISRCIYPRHRNYSYYGGRGITVCDHWRHSFDNFLEDMGERPEGTSLDRIDVNGNYEPTNCRWATRSEQMYNQRVRVSNKSGKVGVSLCSDSGKWLAKITSDGKQMYLGIFESFEDAVAAREAAELEVYGYIKEKDVLTLPPPNAKVLPQTDEQTEEPISKEEQ